MKTLSAYTHAINCTDITDLQYGIHEIREAIKERMRKDIKVPYFYSVRLKKLEAKLLQMQKSNLSKTSINQIFRIRDNLDNLATYLQSIPSYKEECTKYNSGETDYSIIGLLYVASAAVEEIIEKEV